METVEGNVKLGGNPCKAKHSIGVMRRMLNLSLITKNDSSIILCPALGFYFDTKNAYKNSPDFYKFCFGSTMVGHNVSFDISFIYNIAKKLSYNFDNPLMDTLEMARAKLPGLKNYKLATVVDKLNIVLENAHRAINDATATAKVFIKLY